MMKFIILAFLFSVPVFAQTQLGFATEHVRALRNELRDGDIVTLAGRTDQALDALVNRALEKLRAKNENEFADQSEDEWNSQFKGFLTRMTTSHDIGDHAPLIKWLATFYDAVEKKLGVEICKLTHLSDIKTFNYCIPVVFHPATFPMDNVAGPRSFEYLRHCNQGAVYYGLLPVIAYWVVDIACTAATYGGGAVFFCGPVGSLAEIVMAKFFATNICEWIYTKSGGT